MPRRHSFRTLFATFLTLVAASSSFATDGVLEINQTCATTTGCFAGDTGGYPVTISASGSYRLTSDLSGMGGSTDALSLTTSRIRIDLNGFAIVGFAIGSGTSNGISGTGTDGSAAGNAVVENGMFRGFRARAIALGGAGGVRVDNVNFEFNAGGGVALGDQARVRNCIFSANGSTLTTNHAVETGVASRVVGNTIRNTGGRGVSAGDYSIVADNAIDASGDHGIWCDGWCSIRGNTVANSGINGIEGSVGSMIDANAIVVTGQEGIRTNASVITNNAIYDAGDQGINAAAEWVVSGNAVHGSVGDGIAASTRAVISGNTVNLSGQDGIASGTQSVVESNAVNSNSGDGLNLGSGTGYRGNVVNSNTTTVTGSGTEIGLNICAGNTICP